MTFLLIKNRKKLYLKPRMINFVKIREVVGTEICSLRRKVVKCFNTLKINMLKQY
jgi:hypothetical protein